MEQILYPTLSAFFATLTTWFFSRKNTEIEIQIKSADFYRNLLDDSTRRLNQAIDTITAQDIKIKSLMLEIESLTTEIRKYKQLNGKSE